MPLTDTMIRSAKGGERPVKLTDGGGLYLLVMPSGSRRWRMQFRYAGKQKLLTFGVYPAVSLADARRRRDEAKKALAAGTDPSAQVRLEKVAKLTANANTFGVLADEYLAKLKREGRAETTIGKIGWLLDFARPIIGDRPISEINAAEVLAVLRKIEARGRLESARRLRSTIGSVFRYAIATARATDDPTIALRGALTAPKVKSRAAVTDPKAVGALLRAIDGFVGQPTTHAALRLMAILFPRPGELRAAEWTEFNLEQAVWTIPAARTKMRRPHRVPLPPQAIAILKQLREITGGKLVFPSVRTVLRPISDNTLNAALRRLGYSQDDATAHGFRATASTLLNESGKWNADAIERQLAHVENDDVRRAYARGEHWEERVRMMDWWADYLDSLKAVGRFVALQPKRSKS
ncbi:MAG: integrase arm-type DNA-binding domain-containing protein [Xanthobacteraceae bacterium]|nr:integrase arm-type DNA-binding domain-containing protein [Xanthobacteraceae bacterium]